MDPGLAELQTLLFLRAPFKAAMWSLGVNKQKLTIHLELFKSGFQFIQLVLFIVKKQKNKTGM